jgi:hypothetical protein
MTSSGEDFHAVVRSSACAPDHALERHPDGFVAQRGYVWLDMPGKVWHVGEHELEVSLGCDFRSLRQGRRNYA